MSKTPNKHFSEYAYFAELTSRKVLGVISEEELIELEQWLLNHPHLEQSQILSDLQDEQLDEHAPHRAWNRFKQKRKRRLYLQWGKSIAAVTILSIGLAGFYHLNRDKSINTDHSYPVLTQHEAVKEEITLELSSGNIYRLTHNDHLSIDSSRVILKKERDSLVIKDHTLDKQSTLYVPHGQQYEMNLSDGSKITVNANTTVRFPISFSKNERRVEVIGEAFFEVVRDKHRPFIVECGKAEVIVKGTSFMIRNYEQLGSLTTTLCSGLITFQTTTDTINMLPSEQLILGNNGQIEIQQIDLTDEMAWLNGEIIFRNVPLQEVLLRLANRYGFNFRFYQESIGDDRYTASFKEGDDLNRVLQLLEMAGKNRFVLHNNEIEVYRIQ